MNKKTLRKLTLSGVTLGVAALSLTTTTYAWFTTNGSATAKGVSGSVTAAEANMLIKSPTGWNGKTPVYDGSYKWDSNTFTNITSGQVAATFGRETTLINEAGNKDTTLASLKPVSILNATNASASTTPTGSFYTNSDDKPHEYTTEAASSCYLHYQVVIALSGLADGKTYSVKMQLPTLNDKTADQYLLVTDGKKAAGETVTVSIADALSLGIKNTVVNADTADTKKGTITSFSGGSGAGTATDTSSGYYHAVAESTASDAITYYNNVYGLSGTDGKTPIALPNNYTGCYTTGNNQYFSAWHSTTVNNTLSDTNSKTLYTVEGTNNGSFVCVTDLYFFIDGWDYQCFNAIGGLSLFSSTSANIQFKLEAADKQ